MACDNDKSRFGNYLTKNKLLGTNVNLHVVVLDRRSHDLRTNWQTPILADLDASKEEADEMLSMLLGADMPGKINIGKVRTIVKPLKEWLILSYELSRTRMGEEDGNETTNF